MKELKKGEHSALSGTRALFTFVQPTAKLKITYRDHGISPAELSCHEYSLTVMDIMTLLTIPQLFHEVRFIL